jgi:predicted flavoprotein YhiN
MTAQRIIVVGAGAGGMMAAGRAAELGAPVLLLEKTDGPAKKLLISGKTRCNVTNARELDEFIAMYGTNGRFLYRAFHRFFRDDLLNFLKRYDVTTKIEEDGHIFPASDDGRDVARAFRKYLDDNGVELRTNTKVTAINVDGGKVTSVQTEKETFPSSAVILATGGCSYPGTGSSGDGYRMAAALGHTITKIRPALVPLAVREAELARSMQGVSLSNVRLTAYQCTAGEIDAARTPKRDCGRGIPGRKPAAPVIESRSGELMITHSGIGGPATLLMSLAIVDALERGPVSVSIDLRPDIDESKLRKQLQDDLDRHGKKSYRNILTELLPQKMAESFVEITGISPDKRGHEITAEERERLLSSLKSLRFNIEGPLPISAAIVTAGGVSLDEIDPYTIASRLITGLYFCGEVMDIDADTGGYNLQAAFSTGYVAGEEAAHRVIVRKKED